MPSLAPLLAELDARLRLEVDRLIESGVQQDPFRGLYIKDSEVAELARSLGRAGGVEWSAVADDRLKRLAARFGLNEHEVQLLLAAVVSDLDLRYERVFAYLQDDVTRKRPTIDLLLHLFWPDPADRLDAMAYLRTSGVLCRNGLIQLDAEHAHNQSQLARTVRVDERIVAYLLGSDVADERLEMWARVLGSNVTGADTATTLEVQLEKVARHFQPFAAPKVILFEGPPGVGKTAAACDLASRLGLGVLAADVPSLVFADLDSRTAATLAFREAGLQESLIYLSGGGALFEEGDRSRALRDAFLQHHQVVGGPLLISSRAPSDVPAMISGVPVTRIALAMPSNLERLAQWTALLGTALSEDQLRDIASAFRLAPDQIKEAVAVARHRSSMRGATPDELVPEDLYLGCRAVSGRGLASVADEITHHATWDDIVLPGDSLAQLREVCSTVRCRAIVLDRWGFGDKLSGGTGTTALFAGPSGTGKTMAAGIIARELGLPLFRIDLARVVSKWIGETEKNLDRVFKAAEDSNAVLFMDEADALLGKRSEVRDSHDRYANLEISYLLQRMELYDGLAILATNMRQLMDDAFTRRLAFTVLFPMPEEPDRRRLWRTLWPANMPAAEGLDLDALARFRFAGGNIKNVILSAAYQAAAQGSTVKMDHLLHGVRREYQKVGKHMTEAELGGGIGDGGVTNR